MSVIYEQPEGYVAKPGDVDGMAEEVSDLEATGWEGEHAFDADAEDPPHPYWDPVTRRCRPD